MFLIKFAFWLLTLPFRLVFWAIGLTLWVLTLPLRIVFTILGLIGLGRIAQLGLLAGLGYFFYRLVNEGPSSVGLPGSVVAAEPTSARELKAVPST